MQRVKQALLRLYNAIFYQKKIIAGIGANKGVLHLRKGRKSDQKQKVRFMWIEHMTFRFHAEVFFLF